MALLNWQKTGLAKLSDYEIQRQLDALSSLIDSLPALEVQDRAKLADIRDFLVTEQLERGQKTA